MRHGSSLLPLVALLVTCGGKTIVQGGGGAGGDGASGSGAGDPASSSTGSGACYRCGSVFAEYDLELPMCPGEDQEEYEALLACGCALCEDECSNPVDSALCNDRGGVGTPCGQCLEANCPDERSACKAD